MRLRIIRLFAYVIAVSMSAMFLTVTNLSLVTRNDGTDENQVDNMLYLGSYTDNENETFVTETIMINKTGEKDAALTQIKSYPSKIPGQPLTPSIENYVKEHCRRVATNSEIFITKPDSKLPLCPCINGKSVGRSKIDIKRKSFKRSEVLFPQLKLGGSWYPERCRSRLHVAIIIPYRARHHQLEVLLPRLHIILQTQMLNYTIFVVEQRYPNNKNGTLTFNKAMLMNIGFTKALSISDYTCFVFHDVDFIPEDDRSMYTCREIPLHIGAYFDRDHYRGNYQVFGAVTVFTKNQFENVNGFSNRFYGWGGEDNEMMARLNETYLVNPSDVSRYKTIRHRAAQGKRSNKQHLRNKEKIKNNNRKVDGLNTLSQLYRIVNIERIRLCTWVTVDIMPQLNAEALLKPLYLTNSSITTESIAPTRKTIAKTKKRRASVKSKKKKKKH